MLNSNDEHTWNPFCITHESADDFREARIYLPSSVNSTNSRWLSYLSSSVHPNLNIHHPTLVPPTALEISVDRTINTHPFPSYVMPIQPIITSYRVYIHIICICLKLCCFISIHWPILLKQPVKLYPISKISTTSQSFNDFQHNIKVIILKSSQFPNSNIQCLMVFIIYIILIFLFLPTLAHILYFLHVKINVPFSYNFLHSFLLIQNSLTVHLCHSPFHEAHFFLN